MDAIRVDRAVLTFAASGEGDLEHVQGSRADYRLIVPRYAVLLTISAEDQRIDVWAVLRRKDGN